VAEPWPATRLAITCDGTSEINDLREACWAADFCGKKSRFQLACEATRLPYRGGSGDTAGAVTTTLRSAREEARHQLHRGDAVSSISYLPQAFTTLFFLAASLLLGLIR
jgi:hypothetical protein